VCKHGGSLDKSVILKCFTRKLCLLKSGLVGYLLDWGY